MEHRQDIALGALFSVLGAASAWLSSAYSGASGSYPRVLGLVMLALGLLIIVRAVRQSESGTRELIQAPGKFVLTAVVFVAYIGLIVPLGFYTASILLMSLLPLVLGFRRPIYLTVMAIVFIAALFVMFSVVLEKPLPAEVWSSARLGAD